MRSEAGRALVLYGPRRLPCRILSKVCSVAALLINIGIAGIAWLAPVRSRPRIELCSSPLARTSRVGLVYENDWRAVAQITGTQQLRAS
jgi:hypothetical protein